jgi:hypothetical protein
MVNDDQVMGPGSWPTEQSSVAALKLCCVPSLGRTPESERNGSVRRKRGYLFLGVTLMKRKINRRLSWMDTFS